MSGNSESEKRRAPSASVTWDDVTRNVEASHAGPGHACCGHESTTAEHREHPHSHQHAHDHGHHHAPQNLNRSFAIGVVLNVIFVGVEGGYGALANSLALWADAGHNLSDVLGLLLAWGASYLSSKRPSQQRTYGWKSSSILAALFNGQLLLVAVGGIVWEAFHRLLYPAESAAATIVWVAGVGVIINTFTAMLFMTGRHHDLNVRGAYLHMAADAAVSLGVVAAGIAIAVTGLEWIDPVTSLIVAIVILIGTWGLLRESLDLALHAVPRHVDVLAVKAFLAGLPGVSAIHDLHVWAMSTTETALTVHLVIPVVGDDDERLAVVSNELRTRFGIQHTTVQIERAAAASVCPQAPDDVV